MLGHIRSSQGSYEAGIHGHVIDEKTGSQLSLEPRLFLPFQGPDSATTCMAWLLAGRIRGCCAAPKPSSPLGMTYHLAPCFSPSPQYSDFIGSIQIWNFSFMELLAQLRYPRCVLQSPQACVSCARAPTAAQLHPSILSTSPRTLLASQQHVGHDRGSQ